MCLWVLKISLVVAWNCHNSTSTIVGKNEITYVYRNFLAIYRVNCIYSFKNAAWLSLVKLCSIHIILLNCLCNISFYLFLILNSWHKLFNDISIWCKYHKCNTIYSFNTSSKDREISTTVNLKVNLNTFWLAYPVSLHFLSRLWPVNMFKSFK